MVWSSAFTTINWTWPILEIGLFRHQMIEKSFWKIRFHKKPYNREEKLLRHVAMVAKFLDDDKPKTSLKKWTRTVSNFVTLWCVKYWWNFLGLKSKGPYLSLEKEKDNFCGLFTYSIKRTGEIRKFHVAVVPTTAEKCTNKRDAKCKVFFANFNLLLFFAILVAVAVITA